MFSIHSSSLQRTLFSEVWKGRYMINFPITVPQNSFYCKLSKHVSKFKSLSIIEYETQGTYISYFEKMLIDNDEDKLNSLKN